MKAPFKHIEAHVFNVETEFFSGQESRIRIRDEVDDNQAVQLGREIVDSPFVQAAEWDGRGEAPPLHHDFVRRSVGVVHPDELQRIDAALDRLDFDVTCVREHNRQLRSDLEEANSETLQYGEQVEEYAREIEELRQQVCRLERENNELREEREILEIVDNGIFG
jgi:predicted nuclease with TOPRIM domain